jgi:hypothetical protein
MKGTVSCLVARWLLLAGPNSGDAGESCDSCETGACNQGVTCWIDRRGRRQDLLEHCRLDSNSMAEGMEGMANRHAGAGESHGGICCFAPAP